MRALALAVLLLLAGCWEPYARAASSAIDGAVVANNALVDTLTSVQASAKEQRKALMLRIAKTATSKAEGDKRIDNAVVKYRAVFAAFTRAEKIQNALADALMVAQTALKAGESPSLDSVMALYAQLQTAHASVLQALAEVR